MMMTLIFDYYLFSHLYFCLSLSSQKGKEKSSARTTNDNHDACLLDYEPVFSCRFLCFFLQLSSCFISINNYLYQ